jgi:hypothetical protein
MAKRPLEARLVLEEGLAAVARPRPKADVRNPMENAYGSALVALNDGAAASRSFVLHSTARHATGPRSRAQGAWRSWRTAPVTTRARSTNIE